MIGIILTKEFIKNFAAQQRKRLLCCVEECYNEYKGNLKRKKVFYGKGSFFRQICQ